VIDQLLFRFVLQKRPNDFVEERDVMHGQKQVQFVTCQTPNHRQRSSNNDLHHGHPIDNVVWDHDEAVFDPLQVATVSCSFVRFPRSQQGFSFFDLAADLVVQAVIKVMLFAPGDLFSQDSVAIGQHCIAFDPIERLSHQGARK